MQRKGRRHLGRGTMTAKSCPAPWPTSIGPTLWSWAATRAGRRWPPIPGSD